MSLITGSPVGNLLLQEELFIADAPTIFFQDFQANTLFAPDSDGFYWGMSGTATYPAYEVGCVSDVSFTEDVTLNDVLCDNLGVKDTLQQRNYVEFQFAVKSLFPIKNLAQLLNFGAVTQNTSEGTEKSGIGKIDNAQFYHAWSPHVYDEATGDYVAIWLHKCKFVEAFTINMPFGSPWEVTGLRMRAFVDTSLGQPTSQQFGMILRTDPSVIN